MVLRASVSLGLDGCSQEEWKVLVLQKSDMRSLSKKPRHAQRAATAGQKWSAQSSAASHDSTHCGAQLTWIELLPA